MIGCHAFNRGLAGWFVQDWPAEGRLGKQALCWHLLPSGSVHERRST
jgi:hypothetical protein